MERIDWKEVPASLDDVVNLVSGGKLRVAVDHQGREIGAFVSIADLLLLEHVASDPKRAPRRHVLEGLRADVEKQAPDGLFTGRGIVVKDGVDEIALVEPKDLALLEGIDEQIDFEAAKRALDARIADD